MSCLTFNRRHPIRNAKQPLAAGNGRDFAVRRLRLAPFAIGLLLASSLAQAGQNTTTTYEYDPNGNLTAIVSPLDTPDNPVRTEFPWFDSLNRVTDINLPQPDDTTISPTILLQHDGQDRLTVLQDPRLLPTIDDHDGLGNRNSLSSPDSGLSYETHDEAGNLTSRVDARGIQTTYSYDALNRLTQVNYGSRGIPTEFQYDGYAPGPNGGVGLPRSMYDESGWAAFLYDDMGRLTYKVQVPTLVNHHDNWNKGLTFTYGTAGTAKGKLASLNYPSGNQINYSYDAAGRINAITLNPAKSNGDGTNTAVTTTLLSAIKFTPTGQFLSGTFGNNTSTAPSTLSRAYDLDGRVQSYPLGNAKQGGTVRTLTYDAGSRITAMTHTGTGTGGFAPANFNQSLSYDNLDRVTGYTLGSTSSRYSYDDSGNRLTTVNNAATYNHTVDLGSNRVQNTSGPAPAKNNLYDQAGNLLSDGTNTYTYSDRGLMQSASQGLTVTQYAYNGLGQRVMKRGATDAGIVQYVYDPQDHLIGEYDVYGNPIQETVYLGDLPIAVLTQTIGTTTVGTVMVDNSDTANVTAVGSWPIATTPVGFQGSNYQTHVIATAGTTDSFTWKLNLPTSFAGKFWVQARWPADATRASDAIFKSGHLREPGAKTIDQRGNNNTWVTVGMSSVTTGGVHTIKAILTPSATGTVAADAVRTLPVVVTTNVHYLFADHLGTPRVITRASDNKIVWRWDHADPYGVKQPNNNPNTLGAFTYNLRFPGQLYDPETGLYYNGHRYYEPDTGTYTQSDPIGLAGGVNTYAYAYNNPLRWTDPLGLAPGDKYPSQDQAGYDAACDANPLSKDENLEYAGSIYKNEDGTYSYTEPKPGGPDWSNPMNSLPQDNSPVTAWYHTHGAYDPLIGPGNFRFSPEDRQTSDATGKPNYMADPGDNAHRYDPDPLKRGKGNTKNFKNKCGCQK